MQMQLGTQPISTRPSHKFCGKSGAISPAQGIGYLTYALEYDTGIINQAEQKCFPGRVSLLTKTGLGKGLRMPTGRGDPEEGTD